jgi:hypothetical protein
MIAIIALKIFTERFEFIAILFRMALPVGGTKLSDCDVE